MIQMHLQKEGASGSNSRNNRKHHHLTQNSYCHSLGFQYQKPRECQSKQGIVLGQNMPRPLASNGEGTYGWKTIDKQNSKQYSVLTTRLKIFQIGTSICDGDEKDLNH